MPESPGFITFSGIASPIRGRFTMQNGLYPSESYVEYLPQTATLTNLGSIFASLNGQTIEIPGCRLKSIGNRMAQGGQVRTATIEDFRWKWPFAYHSAAWNVRDRYGDVVAGTDKGLVEMLKELGQLMGTTVSIDIVPFELPEMIFTLQPAIVVMESLLSDYGLMACPRYDGSLLICQAGKGQSMPNLSTAVTLPSRNTAKPAAPATIIVVAEPSRFQMRVSLEPVGLETDGKIVPAASLTYAPDVSHTWADYYKNFDQIGANGDGETALTSEQRILAKRCIGKWFRIKMDDAENQIGTLFPETGLTAQSKRECILPLFRDLVQRELPTGTNQSTRLRPQVYGYRLDKWNAERFDRNTTKTNGWRVDPSEWRLDQENGIVIFNEEQFRIKAGAAAGIELYDFATLYLECSFIVEPNGFSDALRRSFEQPTGLAHGIGEVIVSVRGISREKWIDYGVDSGGPVTTKEYIPEATIDDKLKEYATQRLSFYRDGADEGGAEVIATSGEVRYADLVPQPLDGAINAIEMTFDADGGAMFYTTLFRRQQVIPYQRRPEQINIEGYVRGELAREKINRFARQALMMMNWNVNDVSNEDWK